MAYPAARSAKKNHYTSKSYYIPYLAARSAKKNHYTSKSYYVPYLAARSAKKILIIHYNHSIM